MASIKKRVLLAAVIGCGRVGAFTIHKKGDDLPKSYFPTNHCAAIRATRGVKLIAVCDKNPELVKNTGKLYKIKNIYTDFKKMITEQHPDIIAIATRMAGRVEIISFAAHHRARGMHIEKPLASNLKDAKGALDAITCNKVAISYGTVRRYMPIYIQAKQIVESKKFGKLRQVVIDISKSKLMWSHPHSVDLINYFTNNAEVDYVESSFQFKKKNVSKNKIDMDPVLDFGLIKLKNGVSGFITDTNKQCVKLVCEKGEIIVDIGGKSLKTKSRDEKTKNVKTRKGVSGRCVAIAELRDYINCQKPTSLNAEKVLTEQKILLALGYAGVTGTKTRLTEIKNNFTITGKFKNLYP